MKNERRRKCHTCLGSGKQIKTKGVYYPIDMVCMSCGGRGFVGGKP